MQSAPTLRRRASKHSTARQSSNSSNRLVCRWTMDNLARSETADEARAEHGNFEQGRYLEGWEFVSPQAIAQEYVEQMSSCVSAV